MLLATFSYQMKATHGFKYRFSVSTISGTCHYLLSRAFDIFTNTPKLGILALLLTLCFHIFAVLHYLDNKILVNVKLDVSWQKGLPFKVGDQ